MIEKILPGIFRIELPLPDSPLQTVNSYLIKGKNRHLLIDSGMNKDECRSALAASLKKLDIKMEDTDFFITHLHEDHFGLASFMASSGSTIYLNAPEARFWGNPNRWEQGYSHGKQNGFPEEELSKFIRRTPDFLKVLPLEEIKKAVEAYDNQSSPQGRFKIISDGEILQAGDYTFRCIITPGHSSGHACLFEPEKNILFSGDHILETITPAIFLWPGEKRNPLHEYLNSLDRVANLDISTVLPGHRNVFQDHSARISQLKKHHHNREKEIASVLAVNGEKGKNAYEIASGVTWNIPVPWKQFSTELKWMALAETMAHLKYMESKKQVLSKQLDNGENRYFLC